ncbi:MAG: trypsin-like peptidase domain-containing protein [Roseibium sp.]|uniref:trypsin-like peptidase domain-containing protein n=1 Tax=Roseibium sp. TaxID=1936156 RepID=UPI001B2942FC|nr:trypsin-like peptidase domain-containing protein [Roseibium sp.]MBO6894937.1 trypsin-like peptidase domain-containing protein [Roseibium sp.]MBO6930827.1 trypsin-like peptidase domain-containing protein [Roseibium sp.]
MKTGLRTFFVVLIVTLTSLAQAPVRADPAEAFEHVVSVLPVWPGKAQGGTGGRPGQAPEGSGVIIRLGVVATAWHVIEPAERIDVRLADGRIIPARLIGSDAASDIALLEIDDNTPPFELAPPAGLAEQACAIGNAFGLGLSITCGVVSAVGVNRAGFNEIEDFIQTDAAANPGSSGGALVDSDGLLLGMVSAIFASSADANIGVNFAVSSALLRRVSDELIARGSIRYPEPGWRLGRADRSRRANVAAPVVRRVQSDGPAARAGVETGDLILEIGTRRTRTPRDVVTALAIIPATQAEVTIKLRRDGQDRSVKLLLSPPRAPEGRTEAAQTGDVECPYVPEVCAVRQAVFPVSSFDPAGSATRIAPELLVTNRHVVGDRRDAIVQTPSGPLNAVVQPSAYAGDLVLLEVEGLPEDGLVLELADGPVASGIYHTVGADIARREIRVFKPGELISGPAESAKLGRLHVTSQMQPGVSGGALVTEDGSLAAIAVGGGDGRFEAIPVSGVQRLLSLREDQDAEERTRELGTAFARCAKVIDSVSAGQNEQVLFSELQESCLAGANHGQLLEAGRLLARSGDLQGAIRLHGVAQEQVPNSINTRMSLLVSLQLGGRFEEMTEHARWLLEKAGDDPQALRFSIQSGVWGGDPDLAEAGYQALLLADPRQAQAARRFIDNAPPAPPRRQ